MTRTHDGVSRIVRGRVYGAQLGDLPEKYYLAVSNNQRNHVLDSFLAVRLTGYANVGGYLANVGPLMGTMGVTRNLAAIYRTVGRDGD